MLMVCQAKKYSGVALRKESVDRNFGVSLNYKEVLLSLSVRRAWIEIRNGGILSALVCSVALRKESVDRNRIIAKEYDWDARRSP